MVVMPVLTKSLLSTCRNCVRDEAIAGPRAQLRLPEDHQRIAGVQRVQFGRLAVEPDQCAWRRRDEPVPPANADHVQAVRQDFLYGPGQAALGSNPLGLGRRRRGCSTNWTGAWPDGRSSLSGRRRNDTCDLLSRLTRANRCRGDENARRADRRGQVQAESLEPGRHLFCLSTPTAAFEASMGLAKRRGRRPESVAQRSLRPVPPGPTESPRRGRRRHRLGQSSTD